MKYVLIAVFGVCLSFGLTTQAQANTVKVEDAYAFAVPSGGRSAAAFMTIAYEVTSDGSVPDRLMRVETPVAGRAEIHTVLIEDNVMMMRKVEAFPLPPMGKITFSPQGPHIMMMELRQPLNAGQSFPMTLHFEKAGAIEIPVSVRAAGDVPASVRVDEPEEEKAIHAEDSVHEHHH